MENNIIEDNILSVNTQNSRMKIISIEGNEKQENQDGTSNLLVLEEGSKSQDGITVTVENGEVTISGTATANTQLITGKAYLHEGETYYIEKVGTSSNCGFRLQNQKNGAQQHWFATSGEVSFVAEATGEYDLYISTGSGQTPSTSNLKLRVSKESGIEWEQGFMNTPSFDYPSEIKTVGDNINLFDGETELGGFNGGTGDKTNSSTTIRNKNPIYVKGLNKIIFSCNSEPQAVNFYEYDKNNSFLKYTNLAKNKYLELDTNTEYVNFSRNNNIDVSKIKVESGEKITDYSKFKQGNLHLKVLNKNFLDIQKNATVTKGGMTFTTDEDGVLTINGTATTNIYLRLDNNDIADNDIANWAKRIFKKGTYVFSVENLSGQTQDINMSAFIRNGAYAQDYAMLYRFFKYEKAKSKFVLNEDVEGVVYLWIYSGITLNNAKLKFQLELEQEATDIVANEEQNYVIPVQQRMFSGDKFVKVDGIWKEMHTMGTVYSKDVSNIAVNGGAVSGVDEFYRYNVNLGISNRKGGSYIRLYSNYFKYGDSRWNNKEGICGWENGQSFSLGTYNKNYDTADKLKEFLTENNVEFDYELAKPIYLDCTPEQIEVLDKIIYLYDGISNIYFEDDLSPTIEVEIKKIVEDYDAYISTNGYLIIPEYNIKYLINLNESTIPSMPEATETSIKVAGRDGDVPLNTTYEPISFDLVCYTEDNLSVLEKSENEAKVNLFLNSIKNKTKKFAIERDMKFYDIKYNGSLTRTNYPAHLKFSIPFKSSDSYAKDLKDKMIVGNSSEESNTINNVGALFTIKGPATMPIISLNDYSMEYSTSILEGARIEIDSNKSTITHINSDGVKTNVMKYYNHQFPKIENGINILKVLSGVNNSNQVNVKWRDLKL